MMPWKKRGSASVSAGQRSAAEPLIASLKHAKEALVPRRQTEPASHPMAIVSLGQNEPAGQICPLEGSITGRDHATPRRYCPPGSSHGWGTPQLAQV
jgi:hypothetical protein